MKVTMKQTKNMLDAFEEYYPGCLHLTPSDILRAGWDREADDNLEMWINALNDQRTALVRFSRKYDRPIDRYIVKCMMQYAIKLQVLAMDQRAKIAAYQKNLLTLEMRVSEWLDEEPAPDIDLLF